MRVLAEWGAEVQFSSARILDTATAAENMQRLMVEIGSLSEGYSVAGQFIQAKVGESKAGFYALASPPGTGAGVVELLIKNQGGTAELLCAAEQGEASRQARGITRGSHVLSCTAP